MFKTNFNILVGEKIREYAKPLGVSEVTIWAWKSGKSEPKAKNIIEICKHFNVSADWLLGLSTDDNDSCENQ